MRTQIVAVIIAGLCAAACLAAAPARDVSIADAGAVPDGRVNTAVIQKAIDSLAAQGGGTLVIPDAKGAAFVSGALFLKPGVNLRLDKGAILKGTTDIKDYPERTTRIEGHFQKYLPALINAEGIDHLQITGEGTLDGSGAPYWAAFRTAIAANKATKNLDVPRPRLVFISKSKDVTVSGIHFLNSGFWNLHLYNCDGVHIEGLDIKAGAGSPSTDGMDIDSSRNVTIKGCTISVNDDCIALKGSKGPHADEDKDSPPVEHIHISDCTFLAGGSFVTVGSEATVVRDVTLEHCRSEGTDNKGINVLRLKLRPDTPQNYSDIHIKDITLSGAGTLILVAPWTQYFDLMGQPQPQQSIHNVSISDVKGTWGSFGTIQGNSGNTLDDITLENIDLQLSSAALKLSPTITRLTVKNVHVNGADYKP